MKTLAHKILLISFIGVFSINSYCQLNLVPNFSFEIYDTCPNTQVKIQYAMGWSKYSFGISTPDYYNACSPDTVLGVPNNFLATN